MICVRLFCEDLYLTSPKLQLESPIQDEEKGRVGIEKAAEDESETAALLHGLPKSHGVKQQQQEKARLSSLVDAFSESYSLLPLLGKQQMESSEMKAMQQQQQQVDSEDRAPSAKDKPIANISEMMEQLSMEQLSFPPTEEGYALSLRWHSFQFVMDELVEELQEAFLALSVVLDQLPYPIR